MTIRAARPDEVERLIGIETAAGRLFADHGYPALAAAAPATPEQYRATLQGRRVLVAADGGDHAVGFALTEQLGPVEWLCELSVDPAHGRRGIGGMLLEEVVLSARRRGCERAALSTFRAVPFNAPFYARHGFAAVEPAAADPTLGERFHAEVPAGIDPEERVLMIRIL